MKKLKNAIAIAVCLVSSAISFAQETGVQINGLTWATRNVGAPNTFVANPGDKGMYYQWNSKVAWNVTLPSAVVTPFDGTSTWNASWDGNSASEWEPSNDPCPSGWRVPTRNEFSSLFTGNWTTNPTEGWIVGNGDNTLFLPYAGYITDIGYSNNSGKYWCSTSYGNGMSQSIDFAEHRLSSVEIPRAFAFQIRCVQIDTTLSISQTEMSFIAEGEQKTFYLTTTNPNWNISSDASWCTVSPTSGSNNGTINVTATNNPTTNIRTATITITGVNVTPKTTIVIQEAAQSGVQTWNLTSTMTATLDNAGLLTISTTKAEGEAMPDYGYGGTSFNGNMNILSVVIMDKVTSIGGHLFDNCQKITSITIPNSVNKIGSYAFESCNGLTSITIPSSITIIEQGLFVNCTNLTSVTIPNSVTSIESIAFSACSSLASITIPSSVQTIESGAFSQSGLTSITIPSSISAIDGDVFSSCSSLNSITIPNSVQTIGHSSFSGCTSLSSITIPNSVTTLGISAFDSCVNLTSITIPNSVVTISDNAFKNCASLASVTIPSSVTSFGDRIFLSCTSLIDVTVSWSMSPLIPDNIFENVNLANATLHVPNGTKSHYQSEPVWGKFGTIDDGSPAYNLSLSTDTIAFWMSAGHTLTFDITSNTSWNVSSNAPSWLTISPTTGSNNGTINVTAGNNSTSVDNRSALITVSGTGVSTQFIGVSQAGNPSAPTLSINASSLSFVAPGEQKTFEITSNTSWNVSSDASWCTVSPTSGSNNGTINVTAENNPTTSQRTATITVSGTGVAQQTISVTQAASTPTPTLTLSESTLNFSASGEQKTFEISSNINWTVSSSEASWCTVSPTSGSNNGTITVIVTNNPTTNQRPATITVTGTGVAQQTISVTQEAATATPSLSVSESVLNFSASNEQKTFVITSNTSWTVSSSDASWCTVSPSSGSNNGTITVTVTTNQTSNQRPATITISGTGVTQQTISVTQAASTPTPNLTLSESTLNFSASGEQKTFAISSNTNWTVSSSEASWCTVSPTSGSNNGTITVTTAYNSSTNQRTASITVSGTGVSQQTISVLQEPFPSYIYTNQLSLSFIAAGESKTVSIESNANWTVSSSDTWVTISPTSGSNNGTVSITASPNTSTNSRTATITFTTQGGVGVMTQTINVTQAAALSGVKTWNLTATMTATLDNGVLTISTTKIEGEAMPDYPGGAPWNDVLSYIHSLVIKEKVTTIGYSAFYGCSYLSGQLNLPNSITTIKDYAFSGCSKLTGDLIIPNSVTTIGGGAFSGCSGFNGRLIIPNSVTSIEEYAFSGCSKLTGDLIVPNSVSFLARGTFMACEGFTGNLVIGNAVAAIKMHTFAGCTGIAGVIIPNSVVSIETQAFWSCTKLTNVVIPNSITSIQEHAFGRCNGLSDVTVNWAIPLPLPYLSSYIFSEVNTSTITLHVPSGTKSLYQAATIWRNFGTIVEYGTNEGSTGISTPIITNVTSDRVTIEASINPNGKTTAYLVQYSLTPNFANPSNFPNPPVNIGSGTTSVPISQTITGLMAMVTYYFRIMAQSAGEAPIYSEVVQANTRANLHMTSAINLPANMEKDKNYPVSIDIVNYMQEKFYGSFYLKDGETELQWIGMEIISGETITLDNRNYKPASAGQKTITLYYQPGGTGAGEPVLSGQYDNPITVNVSTPTTFTVTFDANGGSPTPNPQNVVSGGKATQPTTPSRTGYTFNNWYDGTTLWNFNNPVTKNMTLKAQWTQNATPQATDIRMNASITGIQPTVTIGQNISFNVMVKNYNTNDWKIAFFLKDAEVPDKNIWDGFGGFMTIGREGVFSINTNSFRVPSDARTGTRTWKLYYWIEGTSGGKEVTSQGSFSNQITVQVNSAPINQQPYLNVQLSGTGTQSNPVMLAGEANASRVFNVESNIDWDVTCNNSWLTVTKNTNNTSFTAKTRSDNTGSPLNAQITVRGTGSNQSTSQIIYIRQESQETVSQTNDYLKATIDDPLPLQATGGTRTITITSNINWTVTADADWLKKLLPTNLSPGSGDKTFSITIPSHISSMKNTANLIISGGGIEKSINIKQNASGGTLQMLILDVNTNTFIEGATVSLSHIGGQTIVSGKGKLTTTVPYGASGYISVRKEGYEKFQCASYYGDLIDVISYYVSVSNPVESIVIYGIPSPKEPSQPQNTELRLNSEIVNIKTPVQKNVPQTFQVDIYNTSDKEWKGNIYFIDHSTTASLSTLDKSREYAVSPYTTIGSKSSKIVVFNFPFGLTGKNYQFAIMSLKDGEKDRKMVFQHTYTNPFILTFSAQANENEFNKKVSEANEYFQDICTGLKYVGYVTDIAKFSYDVKTTQALFTGGGITYRVAQQHLAKINEFSNDLVGLQKYVNDLNTILSKINDIKNFRNNVNSPEGWFKIAHEVTKGTSFASIFDVYLDVGKAYLDQIGEIGKIYDKSVRQYQDMTTYGLNIKVKVVDKKNKECSSTKIQNQIESVDFHYWMRPNDITPVPAFEGFTTIKKSDITISDAIIKIKHDEWSYEMHAWIEIRWKNKKVTWIPFTDEFIKRVDGKYEVTLFTESSEDEIADKLTILK